MPVGTNRPNVPPVHADDVEHRRQIAQSINLIMDGKINAVGEVTLDANTTTTTFTDLRIGVDSVILLMPTTVTAGVAQAVGLHITTTKQSATITHNNSADTDKTFRYAVLGG